LASIQVCLSNLAVTDNGFDLALSLQFAQLFGPSVLVCRVSRGPDGGARRWFPMLLRG
jgi:hypothetical protein